MKAGWIETWKSEPTVDRMKMCIRMIAVHGLLSDSERVKGAKRFLKWEALKFRRSTNAQDDNASQSARRPTSSRLQPDQSEVSTNGVRRALRSRGMGLQVARGK